MHDGDKVIPCWSLIFSVRTIYSGYRMTIHIYFHAMARECVRCSMKWIFVRIMWKFSYYGFVIIIDGVSTVSTHTHAHKLKMSDNWTGKMCNKPSISCVTWCTSGMEIGPSRTKINTSEEQQLRTSHKVRLYVPCYAPNFRFDRWTVFRFLHY